MDHDLDQVPDPAGMADADRCPAAPASASASVSVSVSTDAEWVDAEAALDDCDGYVVVAVDPQTGEVDAHGPYAGLGALHAAEDMRATFLREDLDDVVVRIVRWHTARAPHAAA